MATTEPINPFLSKVTNTFERLQTKCAEIYRIVSQKQLRDPDDDRDASFNNTRKLAEADLPATTTESVRKQCCNS